MWVSSRPRLLVILSLLSTNFLVKAEDHVFEWDLEAVLDNDLSPDCMNIKDNRRFLFLANRSLPGPVIDVTEGDSLTVRNQTHDRVCCTSTDASLTPSAYLLHLHNRFASPITTRQKA